MIVLGFDTATSATAVALRLPGASTIEARDDPSPGAHPGHATRLLGLAAELLAEGGIAWQEVQRIGVGVGPGTFTGLRVGVATARGLAQSLGCELSAVSSLRALSQPSLAGERPGRVLAVIDARRGEVFVAAYGPGLEELMAPRALAPGLLGAALAELGTDAGPWLAIGDGALRYREAVQAAGASVPPDESPLHLLRGEAICELAGIAGSAGGYGGVLPDYRRRPDAELALASGSSGGMAGR
jgi:tRNA threonylcarbamoyladenosine biosynthesis protein TsaB